jgi:long-chain fatty acid transport protein
VAKGSKRSVVLAVALALGSGPVQAANNHVGGVSTKAKAMQNAFTAIADDPSALYYNPAGLVQIEGTRLMLDLEEVRPRLRFERAGVGSARSSRGARDLNVFFSHDLGRATFGLGLFAPFAARTSFSTTGAVGAQRHAASLLRLDLAPTLAFELGRDWAIGAGLTASRVSGHTDVLGFEESLRGYGFTGQAGVLYRGIDRVQLGLSYRGRMSANVEGRGRIQGVGSDTHDSQLRFPDRLSLGAAWEATDAWTLSMNVDWEGWSYLRKFRRDYDNPVLKGAGNARIDARDAVAFHWGAQREIGEHTELRFGYTYQTRAQDTSALVPAMPDFRGQVASLGIGRTLGNGIELEATYEFAHGGSGTRGALFPGRLEASAHFISVGVTIPFGDRR